MPPSETVQHHVAEILGFAPESWTLVEGGYSPARRYIVRGTSGSAFVKLGTSPLTARLLNHELDAYGVIAAPFMPRFIGGRRDDLEPILVIEDLGSATWPPPWTAETTALILDQIRAMHRTVAHLERRTLLYGNREAGWPTVARDPAPFLSLGLVTADWLGSALPVLVAAEHRCVMDGDALTHLDLRSDNICILDGVVKFVDWAEAGIGNAQVDLGFFLPSLAYEGGPQPDAILPDAPEVAALVSGFFAARAGLPIIPVAPRVRQVQFEQLVAALPWVQRALGLPELDGGR